MFKNYYEVRDWLEFFIPQVWGKEELGLARIENLLELLGNPEKKFKSIHVAGTSGKGSTCFYIARLLQLVQGHPRGVGSFHPGGGEDVEVKIGLHISPHLVDIRERMQIFSSRRHPGGSGATDKRACFSQARNRISKSDSIAEFTLNKSRFFSFDFTSTSLSVNAQDQNDKSEGLQNDKGYGTQNDNLMPVGQFVRLFNELKPVVEKIKKTKPDLTPSYFEILVAAAFLYFAEEKVDWAVVEVGLGGRLDATNVLMPEVSVITNIGFDHTEILGKTIEKIAWEKAGIIKKGVPVVTGYPSTLLRPIRQAQGEQAQDRSGSSISRGSSKSSSGRALGVIADVAKKRQAPLIIIDTQDQLMANKLLAVEAVNLSLRGALRLRSGRRGNLKRLDRFAEFTLNKSRFFSFDFTSTSLSVNAQDQNDKSEGLAMTKGGLPGRFEEIEPGVILDGAHNPDKIRFLINILRASRFSRGKLSREVMSSWSEAIGSRVSSRQAPPKAGQVRTINRVILVVAFKKGKQWKKMVDLLIKNLPIKQVIATKFSAVTDTGPAPFGDGVKKFAAVDAKEIADYVKSRRRQGFGGQAKWKVKVESRANSQEAVFEALMVNGKWKMENSIVLVTGSLYLVGEVRTIWHLPEF